MSLDVSALPDDVETLRAIVAAQAAELSAKDSLIGSLRLQLARLRRVQFGRSSERLAGAIEQLELALEDLEAEESGAGLGVAEDDGTAADAASPHAARCRTTCRARWWNIPLPAPARRVVGACAGWART